MELLLKRQPAVDRAIPGELYLDGRFAYFTLERQGVEIPVGRYRVVLTVSARASRGELWSPDRDHRLPLIADVPGRSGIRIHALNEAEESDGCVGVGLRQAGITIRQSRSALTQLVAALAADKTESAITIEAPSAERTWKA